MTDYVQTYSERMNVERIAARSLLILGGSFWAITAFAGRYSLAGDELAPTAAEALLPLMFTAVVYVVAAYSERAAALLLALASVAVAAWGVAAGWEMSLWLMITVLAIGPMLLSATLFYFASRIEDICADESSADDPAEPRSHVA
jgi:hypothetical protein